MPQESANLPALGFHPRRCQGRPLAPVPPPPHPVGSAPRAAALRLSDEIVGALRNGEDSVGIMEHKMDDWLVVGPPL